MESSPGASLQRPLRGAVAIMMARVRDVRGGVEEVVFWEMPDRLERRPEGTGGAEEQRGGIAAGFQREKVTSATAIRPWPDESPLVPRAGIEERQAPPTPARKPPTVSRPEPHPCRPRRSWHRGRRGAVAGHTHDEADPRAGEAPPQHRPRGSSSMKNSGLICKRDPSPRVGDEKAEVDRL